MLIDGEKWACEACVRGHRVSSCHHSGKLLDRNPTENPTVQTNMISLDRPLTHINKKGRPVSQCPHCRGLRKSRTTHTKCECGDKKKTSHKNDLDPHSVEKRDLKREHDRNSNPDSLFLICILQRTLIQDVAVFMDSAAPVL